MEFPRLLKYYAAAFTDNVEIVCCSPLILTTEQCLWKFLVCEVIKNISFVEIMPNLSLVDAMSMLLIDSCPNRQPWKGWVLSE